MPVTDNPAQFVWMLSQIMGGLLGAVFLIVVIGCVCKGAYDDLVRLINFIKSRRQQDEDDKQFFDIVKGIHDHVR